MERLTGSFCIDATEVTNLDYGAWLDTGPSTAGQRPACAWNDSFVPWDKVWPVGADRLEHPISGVDFCDADAYCRWAGKRLCRAGPEIDVIDASDEWRSVCTHEGEQDYPYGDSFVSTACNGDELDIGDTLPVGSLASCEGSYPGVFDMVGNVSEWVDKCDGDTGSQDHCWMLGGDWFTGLEGSCYSILGWSRHSRGAIIGFRCCRDAE